MNYMEQVIYNRQGTLITELNETVRQLKSKIHNLEKENTILKREKNYYSILQNIVIDNPVLQSEWDKFLVLIKLSCDEKEVKKLL